MRWPRGSPVTLHTLAALMISQSDNSATDMLLHVARPGECRADDGDDRGAAGSAQPAFALDAGAWRRSRPGRPPRSTPGGRPTKRAGGGCSPRVMPAPTRPDRPRPLHRQSAPHRQRRMVRLRRRPGADDGLAAAQRRRDRAGDPGDQSRPRPAAARRASPISATKAARSRACSTSPGWSAAAPAPGTSSPAAGTIRRRRSRRRASSALMARAVQLVR